MPHSAVVSEKQDKRTQDKQTQAQTQMQAHALLTTKHAPHAVNEIAGNDEAKENVKKWAFDWQRGKKGKPLLIFGPTGCGKTALARALAAEMHWTIVESNASTDRGGSDFAKLASNASSNYLYGGTRLLFIDEIDAVFDRVARGEGGKALATALVPVLEERAFPVILAAENAWEPKLAALRPYCSLVEFKRVNWRAMAKTLGRIAESENCTARLSPEKIEEIARTAGGDLRAAINDLQVYCSSDTDAKTDADTPGSAATGAAAPSDRDRQEKIFETLRQIFHAKTFADALRAADASGEDLERLVLWINENVAREYENADEVAAALDSISKATLFQSRIRRSQNWSLLKYVRCLAFAGVAAARSESKPRFVSYAFPSVLKSLGESKKNRALLKSGIQKIEASLHCSKKQALETSLVFAKTRGFASFFDFTKEEAELFSSLDELER